MAGFVRLLRLQKAFAARKKALELRLLRLERFRQSHEDAVIEISQSLASPLIAALPLFVASVRRLKQLEGEIAQIDHDITELRGKLIESHARSKLSGITARQRSAAWEGAREASGMLEIVTGFGRSSLPQDSGD